MMTDLFADYDKIFVAADTHLNKTNEIITANFFKLLEKCVETKKSCLIIAGDFVDFWFENQFFDLAAEYPVFNKIRDFIKQNSYDVFLIKGNRDFLAAKKFEKITGITVLGDDIKFRFNSKKYMICHGDNFCSSDITYSIWRDFSRGNMIKIISLVFPKFLIFFIIKFLRSLSYVKNLRETKLNLSIQMKMPYLYAAEHKLDYIICGHNHCLRTRRINFVSDIKTVLIVLHRMKDWGTYYLELNNTGPVIKVL
jgi:UDP-2,3-diacylglucosamine hydrolase